LVELTLSGENALSDVAEPGRGPKVPTPAPADSPGELIHYVPVPVCIEDWSRLRDLVVGLQSHSVSDWANYIAADQPAAETLECAVRVVDVNSAGVRFFGASGKTDLAAQSGGVLGRSDDGRAMRAAAVAAFARGETTWEGQGDAALDISRQRPVQITAVLDDVAKGDWARVIVTIQDLADGVHGARDESDAEAELRESEARFRTIVENLPGMVYRSTYGDSATMIYFSQGIEELTGYRADELIGQSQQSYEKLVHPEDWPRLLEAIETGGERREPVEVQYRIQHRDGSIRWAVERGQPVYDDDGNALWLDGVVFDITELKRIEQELAGAHVKLRESEFKFRAMIENVPGAIYQALPDDNWTDIFISDAVEDISGYPAADFIGSQIRTWSSVIHPDDRARYDQSGAEEIKAQQPYDVEYRILHADGGIRWVRERGRGVYSAGGDVQWLTGAIFDMTEQVRNKEARHDEEERFRAMVANVPGAIYQARPDDEWADVFVSDTITDITGYPASEFVDAWIQKWSKVVHPDDWTLYMMSGSDAIDNKQPYNVEYRIIHADGSMRWLRERGRGIYNDDGKLMSLIGAIFDVTERVRIEEAQREDEERFRSMVANVPGVIYRCAADENWTMEFISGAIREITGYPVDDFLGNRVRSFASVIHPDDVEAVATAVSVAIAAKQPYVIEYRLVHADGSVRHVHEKGRGIFDSSGQLKHLDGAVFDVTEHKRTQLALEDSFEEIDSILDAAVDSIITIDETGAIERFNPAAEKVFGYVAEDVIGQNVKMLMPDPLRSSHDGYVAAAQSTGMSKVIGKGRELTGLRKDGSEFPLELAVGDIRSQGARKFVGTLRDISERKEAERALLESETRFRSMVANVPGAFYRTELDGQTLFMSDAIEAITGYPADQFLDIPIQVGWHFVEEEDAPLVEAALAESLRTGKPFSVEYRIHHADGSTRWLHELGQAIRDPGSDEPRWLDGFVIDVTERKTADALVHAARDEAERANKTKSEFLAGMSHELRTPLNAVIGFSEAIRTEMVGPIGNPKYVAYAKDINDSGCHLLELINDLLDMSKIESGHTELIEEHVSIEELVGASVSMIRQRAEEGGLMLESTLPENAPNLYADRLKLKQVLINLLANAVKFTPEGGTVRLDVIEDIDGGIEFRVSDTGIGMAPDEIPTALEQFGQVDGFKAGHREGTGLGLPISKSLVELHDGRFEIESAPGEGTTVRVILPGQRVFDASIEMPQTVNRRQVS
jgi:PAS domain S-box-containing protein